jgi:AcrR family transcriptional regulator
MEHDPTAGRTLRSDARRNRDRILDAAQRSFATDGLEIGVDEIACRAGVGVGTLYRRFPSKESLIHAIFERRLDDLQPVIDRALAAADPWDGFVELLLAMVAQQIEDQGFSQMIVTRLGPEAVPVQIRRRFLEPVEVLMARAQSAGRARTDITAADLPAIVRMAGASALGANPACDWRRHVGMLLDGLAAPEQGSCPPG